MVCPSAGSTYYLTLATYLCWWLLCSGKVTQGLPNLNETSQEPVIALFDEEALIDCNVKDIGNYTVLWRFVNPSKDAEKGEVLTAGKVRVVSDTRISVLHNPEKNVWVLQIRDVRPSDSGIYVCEVNTVPKLKVARILSIGEEASELNTDRVPSVFSEVEHNYTDCCRHEKVPLTCHNFCHFKGLVSEGQPPQVIQSCISHLPSITKCLADGRNHMPCCRRQNIPQVCRPVCVGNFTLNTVLDHFTCMDYTAPVLACIAEGIVILPPPPKEMTVEPVSSTELIVKWKKPIKSLHLVDVYQINVTQLHSFDGFGVSRLVSETSAKEGDMTPPLYGLQMRFTVNASVTEFLIKDLKPYTMYEIEMMSINKLGTSLPTDAIRTLTLQPEVVSSEPTKSPKGHPEPDLPDIKKCCQDDGVQLGRCLEILCDPVKADEATLTDMMICAPWANITFKCMATGVDHTDCCEQRGVSSNCMGFCRGNLKRLDFRHFVCLDHMSSYSSCILDHHGVLPSPPQNFMVVNVHHDWAILKWFPPSKLAHTVVNYHVHWRETGKEEANKYQVAKALKSPYLLDNLTPGGRYEVYVSATNQYGMSQASSRVIFLTPPLSTPEEIELQDANLAYNETACCVRAGLASNCSPLCSYRVKVADVIKLAATCANSLTTLVRCAVGGRNHVPCCRRRGINDGCLNLCAGIVDTSPYVMASRCADDLGKILQCMEEGTGILPGMPVDFHAVLTTKQSIHLKWKPAPEDEKMGPINYQIRYGKIKSEIPLHPLDHEKSLNSTEMQAVLDNLEPGARYSIYIVAANAYGISLPSLVLVVNTSLDEDDTTVVHSKIGPPHAIEILQEGVDTITFKWLPPLYVPPDSVLSYTVHYKAINGTEPETIPGVTERWIQVNTSYNTMYITNLTYNTQYAIAVQAKTDKGSVSSLSEVALVWTDPAIPASVNLPVIIPAGPIIETTNVTIMCIGLGTPTPMLSMLINGQIAMKEERRHITLTIPRVQRNFTSVSCYATNGYGKDAQSAQSTLEIRVRFKPSVAAHPKITSSPLGGPARIQCEISGNPQPRVTWFRDLQNHVQVQSGPNIDFVTVPHTEAPSTWINTLLIKQATEEDAGNYLCSAANEFGQDAATITLKMDATEQYSRNASACCAKQSVAEGCRPACSFDIDIDKALTIPACYGELDKLMACAADGSDHRQCCRRRQVSTECIRWCAGLRVTKTSLCAVTSSREIVSCFQEGKALLPGPPKDVHVKHFMEDNKVLIEWEPPQKNPELVQWYRVFWRPVGSRDLNRSQTDKPYFEIQGLDSEKMYEFVVKSGNHYGLSVFTDPLVISMHAARTSSSIGNKLLKAFLGIAFTAVVLILVGGLLVFAYRRYYVPKANQAHGVSFENPSYMKDGGGSVQFQDTRIDPAPNGDVEMNANKVKSDEIRS